MTRFARPALVALLAVLGAAVVPVAAAEAVRPPVVPDTILYGAAYYHEYMPYERLE